MLLNYCYVSCYSYSSVFPRWNVDPSSLLRNCTIFIETFQNVLSIDLRLGNTTLYNQRLRPCTHDTKLCHNHFVLYQMFIQIHKPKSTGEIISLERRLYEVVQKEWDSQEPTGHSFALQTQKDVSTSLVCHENSFAE